MFRANTLEDRLLCDILIETKNVSSYKTFDLENVNQIARIGYNAAVDAFDKYIEEQHMIVKVLMAKKDRFRKE
jgi:NTE family protein